MRLSSVKSVNISDSSNSNISSLSPHESSVDEEEMLINVQKLLKNDTNLAKIAKKMRIDNLYKKYFSIKSDENVVEEEALRFLNSIKGREQKLKRGTMLTADKLIEINRYNKNNHLLVFDQFKLSEQKMQEGLFVSKPKNLKTKQEIALFKQHQLK